MPDMTFRYSPLAPGIAGAATPTITAQATADYLTAMLQMSQMSQMSQMNALAGKFLRMFGRLILFSPFSRRVPHSSKLA